jgi:ATP-dependent Lhr-like helicase
MRGVTPFCPSRRARSSHNSRKAAGCAAQQTVAAASSEDWDEDEFFDLARSAWPYRNLTREQFDAVVKMLAEGFSTKRGRRAALIHHDAVNHRLRGRRGARLVALTSGGRDSRQCRLSSNS